MRKRPFLAAAAVLAGSMFLVAVAGLVLLVTDDSIPASGMVVGPVEAQRDRDARYSVLVYTGDDDPDQVLARSPVDDEPSPEIYILWFDSVSCGGEPISAPSLTPGTHLDFRHDPVVLTSSPAVLVATRDVAAECDGVPPSG